LPLFCLEQRQQTRANDLSAFRQLGTACLNQGREHIDMCRYRVDLASRLNRSWPSHKEGHTNPSFIGRSLDSVHAGIEAGGRRSVVAHVDEDCVLLQLQLRQMVGQSPRVLI